MIQPDEGDFVTFSSKGMDPIERASHPGPLRLRPVLDGCTNCHHVEYEPAIQTIQSLPQILRPMPLVDSRHFPPTNAATEAKRHSYEWGVLQALWQTQSR